MKKTRAAISQGVSCLAADDLIIFALNRSDEDFQQLPKWQQILIEKVRRIKEVQDGGRL